MARRKVALPSLFGEESELHVKVPSGLPDSKKDMTSAQFAAYIGKPGKAKGGGLRFKSGLAFACPECFSPRGVMCVDGEGSRLALAHPSRTYNGFASAATFLRGPGSKKQLVDKIIAAIVERAGENFSGTYHEPFLFTGAVWAGLAPRFSGMSSILSDLNPMVHGAWRAVATSTSELLQELGQLQAQWTSLAPADREAMYYACRDEMNRLHYDVGGRYPGIRYAALVKFINATCYNGLMRFNRDGGFNVPVDKSRAERGCKVFDGRDILTASHWLNDRVTLAHGNALELLRERLKKKSLAGHLFYFDPPYYNPDSTKRMHYVSREFTQRDHVALAEMSGQIAEKGGVVVASNSNEDFVHEVWGEYGADIEVVSVNRSVSCDPSTRGEQTEVLMCIGGDE